MAVTIQDLALYRGMRTDLDGSYTYGDILEVGLDLLGGCAHCGASITSYNAYPSRSGYWACEDCIGDAGWEDAGRADLEIFGDAAVEALSPS